MQADIAMLPQLQALVHAACGVCGSDDPAPVAVGANFSAPRANDETFLMVRCRACGLLYLNPRPAVMACDSGAPQAGGSIRPWFAARRFGARCRSLAPSARILDVAVAPDLRFERNRAFARSRGLTVDRTTANERAPDEASYDLIVVAGTIERVAEPAALLATLRRALRPRGRLIVTTGNAGAFDRRIFGNRYWGGYNFPRNASVFTEATLARLAVNCGLRVVKIATSADAASWIASIRNALIDMRAPRWLVARFRADARASLVFFAALDGIASCAGYGGLLHATFERPAS